MNYDSLDINQRINLKGLVQAWQRITLDRFRDDLTEKLYNRKRMPLKRSTGSGPQGRNRKGRFVARDTRPPLQRTRQLINNWRMATTGSGDDVQGSQISFLLYGRFVDMGVGRGTDYALSKYQGVRANGEPRTRRPVRWYSKRKGYETHRLRELLVRHYIDIPLEVLENALTSRVELTL